MRNIGNQMSVIIIIYVCAQTIHILLKWHQILCPLFVILAMMHSDRHCFSNYGNTAETTLRLNL